MNRTIAAVVCLLAILSPARAQKSDARTRPAAKSAAAPVPAETKLPSKAEIDAALQRTLGYDRSLSWAIQDIRPSPLPGVTEVLVSINKQAPNRLFISPDGQNAVVVADVIPFGPDPFARAREDLKAADGPARGAQSPVIFTVEFSDLQCPHCKAAQPVVDKLAADFPQVRFIFQQFPLPATLHPWAMKAAKYTDCAGRAGGEAFWKYVDSIFETQGGIAETTADDKLKELATAAGLDAEKISACATSPETDARIKKSMDLGNSLEVNETPTVFVNGRRVKGIASIPYDQLKNLIQFEIDHAGK